MNDVAFAPNQCCPQARLFCGGQPSTEKLAAFAREGGRCVVNLRPRTEQPGWDEAAAVHALGMDYVHIPVAGPGDLDRPAAQRLAETLRAHGDAHVLIHCASGQRVAALLSLKSAWIDGLSADRAIEVGRKAGLAKLEPAVRAQLEGAGRPG